MSQEKSAYLTFRIGGEWYGIPVSTVIEVLHMVALNHISQTDVLGVMTLRERVMPVIDLRQRFNLACDFQLDTPIIATQTAHGPLGLVVDEADNVLYLEQTQFTPYTSGYVRNAIQVDGRMIFALDIDQLEMQAANE